MYFAFILKQMGTVKKLVVWGFFLVQAVNFWALPTKNLTHFAVWGKTQVGTFVAFSVTRSVAESP